MARVYIVTRRYHEHSRDPADLYTSDAIEKVFKSEDKAIDYIYDRIRESHKEADRSWPNDEYVVKYEPDMNRIREDWNVESWERVNEELYVFVSYKYTSYVVE